MEIPFQLEPSSSNQAKINCLKELAKGQTYDPTTYSLTSKRDTSVDKVAPPILELRSEQKCGL